MNFASSWKNLIKNCISADFLLMEEYVQSDAQKEHLEHFKIATLGKALMINFASICNNLLKHSISVKFLLMECYVKCALRKELYIASFIVHFKTTTWGKSH